MAQKLKTKTQLPQIYRTITAGAVVLIVTLLGFNVGFLVKHYIETRQEEEETKNNLLAEERKWESIKEQYPDYRDAYFQLAMIAYRLNDTLKAGGYVEKALSIDPNYKPARELKNVIELNSRQSH